MDEHHLNKTARWTFYTTGGILILLGIILLLNPMFSAGALGFFAGIGFLIAGLNNLVPYFSMRDNPERPKWFLPLGVIDLVVGMLFITRIGLAVFTISTLLALWIFLGGIMRFWISFQRKAAGDGKWWMSAASGVLLVLCALVLFSNPFAAVFAVTFISGAVLIAIGAIIIAEGRMSYPHVPKRASQK